MLATLWLGAVPAAAGGEAASLVVRPGEGIGPVTLGMTRGRFERRFPDARLGLTMARTTRATLRLPGGSVQAFFAHDHIGLITSSSRSMSLDGRRLSGGGQEMGRLRAEGWRRRRCGPGFSILYRVGPTRQRLTTISFSFGRLEVHVADGGASSFGCGTIGGAA
jgi:hypothetical protein